MSVFDPAITVITSVLDSAAPLPRLLDSLAAQSSRDFEHIVMDGGSTDGTLDILTARDEAVTYWESAPDRGVYHAWNKALEHASGRWCCFLGADDFLWDEQVVARAIPHLEQAGSEAGIVYGLTHVVDSAGHRLDTLGQPWPQTRAKMRENMALPNPSTFWNRSLFDTLGGFDESYRIAGDYEFALRALRATGARFIEALEVAGMQEGGQSVSRRHAVATIREVLRARREHGLSRLPVCCHPRLLRVRLQAVLSHLLGERAALRLANTYRSAVGKPPLREN